MEWTGARYADSPTVESQSWIGAPPPRVWELVSDVELMPTLSSELQSVRWLDGATGPAPGARFEGRNRHPAIGEWTTTSHVLTCAPPREFSWAVENPEAPAALWRFTLEPHDGGTLLHQWVRLGPGPSGLSYAIARAPEQEQQIVFVRLRELERSIGVTLDALKELAERPEEAGA
ncbi:SRPBCC family protein [Streptomyces lydicus]|uniref:SRPBCC family protein n=1 Tax=Streptomyces lydicus TaxID=47763 RepID=UPI00379FA469